MIGVYLDANILITAFEDKTESNGFVWQVLAAVERRSIIAVTSQMTLAEVLPKPLAKQQLDLVQVYESLLAGRGVFEVLPITSDALGLTARIRADRLSIKLPDAIHLATARIAVCDAIFSGDKRLALPNGTSVVAPGSNSLEQLLALKP